MQQKFKFKNRNFIDIKFITPTEKYNFNTHPNMIILTNSLLQSHIKLTFYLFCSTFFFETLLVTRPTVGFASDRC
jgi:hypothetical protein